MSTLVVMAAGMGSRYGGLKQVDPMGPSGETLVDFSVFDAIRAGFKKMVFVIKPEFEDVFRERISDRYRDAAEVVHVYQGLDVGLEGLALAEGRQKPWGTGHALLCAANAVTGAFAVINADDFYGHSSFRMIADYLSADSGPGPGEAALVGFALKNTLSGHGHVSRGVCTLGQEMHLQEVIERTRISRRGHSPRHDASSSCQLRPVLDRCGAADGDEQSRPNPARFGPRVHPTRRTRRRCRSRAGWDRSNDVC